MKKITTITIFLLITLGLASCENTNIKDTDIKSTATVKTDKTTTNTKITDDNTTDSKITDNTKKIIPKVFVIGANEKLKEKTPEGLILLSDEDEISKKIKKIMKEHSGESIHLEPNPQAKAKGAKSLDMQVFEYGPIFAFDVNTKDFEYDRIKKESPNLIYTIDTKKGKLFVFKDPSFIGGNKEYVILNDTLTNFIKNNSLNVSQGIEKNKKVLFVEDPLCPFCAKSFLSTENDEILKKYSTNIVWVPLNIPGHENSAKLINFIYLNSINGQVNNALIKGIFEKQDELSKVDIKDGTNIKKILESSSLGDDVKQLKTGDLSKSVYNKEKVDKIANLLGVRGTPTKFIIDGNKYTLFNSILDLNK